ncbi:putative membrane spanning protein [Cupriavidus necator]|uniref:Putative membrane spanning protein n=1 Tax=Cupriavidus necator TaxID=106590 RepID=A0A1U9USE2_CUPNE|nr:hypothetical protein [Cupriavidus necator]AQV95608.1 putative membrane spanning protein [Cupriavidus necator]
MKRKASKVVRLVDLCAVAMTLLGITFAVIAARSPVTLAQVTTGSLAAIAGITVFCAAAFALAGLLLLLFVLLRQPGERLRASLSYAIGVCLFVAVFLATDRWVTRQLPERHGAALGACGSSTAACAPDTSWECAHGARLATQAAGVGRSGRG